ncbi:MAG: CCA tRNA nucleotidyltransferase [Nitrospirae bacterium]|nr:MAG: CCA tRNA nucleotidyltransferase [Nitrospirota bacterium]
MEHRWEMAPARRRRLARIVSALAAAGHTARLCGGGVRDRLLGIEPADDDLACDAPPERVAAALEQAGIKVVPTGIAHGTVTAVVEGEGFEITTLRRDIATFGRQAEVAFGDVAWEEDARRRDFTINALYADLDGRIYDPVGGLADLEAGRVRFVGDPEQRIKEDFLRILRLFRFHARFGRHPLDPGTLEAVRRWAPYLTHLSRERVGREWWALLETERPRAALEAMQEAGVLTVILPEIGAMPPIPQANAYHDRDCRTHSWHCLFALLEMEQGRYCRIRRSGGPDPDHTAPCPPLARDPLLRHLALFHDLAKPLCHRNEAGRDRFLGHDRVGAEMIARQMRRLCRPRREQEVARAVIRSHLYLLKNVEPHLQRRLYRRVGEERFALLVALALADGAAMQPHVWERCARTLLPLRERLPEWEAPPPLPVSGRDLIERGVAEGPAVGALLAELRAWWEGEEPPPDRDACLAWLDRRLAE